MGQWKKDLQFNTYCGNFFYSCQHLLRSNFLIDRKLYQNKAWFYKQSTYVMNMENVERPLRYIKKNPVN